MCLDLDQKHCWIVKFVPTKDPTNKFSEALLQLLEIGHISINRLSPHQFSVKLLTERLGSGQATIPIGFTL